MARRLGHVLLLALPAVAILVVTVADLAVGQSVVLGLVVVAPLLAANVTGPVLTGIYAVLALVTGVALGVHDDAYRGGDPTYAQVVRLAVIAAMGVVGVLLSRYRLAREQRLTQVIKVADAAQRAILLPVPDELGPVNVAVTYESAASEAMVGGDLYGFVVTRHGLRVLVGDVRGKGLDAVRMSAQVLATFRERANDDPELPALMTHLDGTVARVAESDEDFVTAVLLELADDGTLSLSNAGHPPPVVMGGGGVRWLEADPAWPPLGLGGARSVIGMRLAPADRVLVYTDGLTEARHPASREFLSRERIIDAVSGPGTVTEAMSRLASDVAGWSGGALHDDIALVLIEYRPDRDQLDQPWESVALPRDHSLVTADVELERRDTRQREGSPSRSMPVIRRSTRRSGTSHIRATPT
jgi:sigma-B regulation protein RsbU (phosphoserine phosphatase)